MMITPSNFISLLRAPIALLFLAHNPIIRICAVIGAMLSDIIDGYLARRYRSTSRLGAILDPLMDKFFVFFVLSVFFYEQKILLWQALLMLSRDIALVFFALYLSCIHQIKGCKFRCVIWGKVATSMQFILLIGITLNLIIPNWVYYLFIPIGILVLIELIWTQKSIGNQMQGKD